MNILRSKCLLCSKTHHSRLTTSIASVEATGFLFLSMLALWLQSSSPCRAQDAVTNSPAANAADSLTNSIVAPTANSAPIDPSLPQTSPLATNSPASSVSGTTPPDHSPPSLEEAARLYSEGQPDQALLTVNAVLATDSNNLNAYILRGAIYARKQAWDQSEKDYQTALQMDPKNEGVSYDLADLKFKQKQFDAARQAFVPLQHYKDATISDLIRYKIFLCDLFAGHDDLAAKELDAFNQAESNGSYYFGNAAWDITHKKTSDARGWLTSANHIYPERKNSIYESPLKDMGYLPLPPDPSAP